MNRTNTVFVEYELSDQLIWAYCSSDVRFVLHFI